MSLINLQKRLAASIIKCGKRKIWMDPNEIKEISLADSRKYNIKIF
jgi:large subunit ribosomal protein L19e